MLKETRYLTKILQWTMMRHYKKTLLIPSYEKNIINALLRNIEMYRQVMLIDKISILISFPVTLIGSDIIPNSYTTIKEISVRKMETMVRKTLIFGDNGIKIVGVLPEYGDYVNQLIGKKGFSYDDLMIYGILGLPEAEVKHNEQIREI